MTRRVCPACKGFMSSRARSCPRCVAVAKAAVKRAQTDKRAMDRHQQRTSRELIKLRDTAKQEAWRLPRLQQAIDRQRKTSRLPPPQWESVVHAVFGAPPAAIVDPRQMSLFDAAADPSSRVQKTA